MGRARRKLFILLGAGSSVSLGVPGVRQIDALMHEWAAAEGVFEGERHTPNYYDLAWQAVGDHYAGSRGESDAAQNFEIALAQMLALANWVRPRPFGRPLRDLIGATDQIPHYFAENRDLDMSPTRFGPSVSVQTLYSTLIGKLADHMRKISIDLTVERSESFDKYVHIFERLRERFEVGTYSLNYDNLALRANPQTFVGFSESLDADGCRIFDPEAVYRRPEWDFLYHLHGSIHYTLPLFGSVRSEMHEGIRWRDDLRGEFQSANTHGGSIMDQRSDGTDIPATTLVAGGQKLDQMLTEPFQAMYASLARHAHEADAFLIAGYGFGDMHVNRALLSRMSRPGTKPPVVILEWTPSGIQTMTSRPDGWPRRLRYAFGFGGPNFDLIPGTVAGLQRRRWFEQGQGHVAVWHNGFLEAIERLDVILDALDGNWKAIRYD